MREKRVLPLPTHVTGQAPGQIRAHHLPRFGPQPTGRSLFLAFILSRTRKKLQILKAACPDLTAELAGSLDVGPTQTPLFVSLNHGQ